MVINNLAINNLVINNPFFVGLDNKEIRTSTLVFSYYGDLDKDDVFSNLDKHIGFAPSDKIKRKVRFVRLPNDLKNCWVDDIDTLLVNEIKSLTKKYINALNRHIKGV